MARETKAMGRPKRTNIMSPDQINRMVLYLSVQAEGLKKVIAAMHSGNVKSLELEHLGMACRGLESLERFVKSVEADLELYQRGNAREYILDK